MSKRGPNSMAPDSHNAASSGLHEAGAANGSAETPLPPEDASDGAFSITSPLPSGILFKGVKKRQRVTFRDSNLVNIREIPPRSRAGSSSGDDDEESDDEDSDESDSDEDTDSDSDNDEKTKKATATPNATTPPKQMQQQPANLSHKDRAVTVTRTTTTPVAPVSSIAAAANAAAAPGGNVRPERAPIPWRNNTTFNGPKGSYEVTNSPASKVVNIVSQITGVSSAATQSHLKHRAAAAAGGGGGSGSGGGGGRMSPSPPRPVPHPKSPPPVVRVVKKVKKITPTLDNVMTSQTVRSVQKHGAVSDSLHKGGGHSSNNATSNGAGKTTKKKRLTHRRQEGESKRKAAGSRKARDTSKQSTASSRSKMNSASPTPGKSSKAANGGLGHAVRDSLSLPKLSADDTLLLQAPPRALQQLSLAKSTVYSLDGFIFPGDPAHDLVAGIKAVSVSPTPEDNARRAKPQVPAATPVGNAAVVASYRERVSSAPPQSSSTRRKRYYAWQMANNGTLLHGAQSPCITPLWDSIQPMATPVTAKPAHDR